MISKKIEQKLDIEAIKHGLRVKIAHSDKPRRRWYSVGLDRTPWHQITGFTEPDSVREFLKNYKS